MKRYEYKLDAQAGRARFGQSMDRWFQLPAPELLLKLRHELRRYSIYARTVSIIAVCQTDDGPIYWSRYYEHTKGETFQYTRSIGVPQLRQLLVEAVHS